MSRGDILLEGRMFHETTRGLFFGPDVGLSIRVALLSLKLRVIRFLSRCFVDVCGKQRPSHVPWDVPRGQFTEFHRATRAVFYGPTIVLSEMNYALLSMQVLHLAGCPMDLP